MLDFPDDTQPIFLSTDASKIGLGGILYQEIHGVKRILYYHSELLSSSQNRFHSIELEALTIFKCITRMKSFLLGRDIIILTDKCPLCHMMNKTISNKRVEKISLLLQEFNITQLIHVQEKHNCLPDYLSRHPISYDDELLDSEYGLGFRRDKSSSVQFIGAMVNRSKVRAASTHVSPYSLQRPQFSSAVSSSSTPATISSSSPIEEFDITQLQQHQNNDIQIQKLLMI
ncbi:unnamed protein product [Rotaria magnacalcarata]